MKTEIYVSRKLSGDLKSRTGRELAAHIEFMHSVCAALPSLLEKAGVPYDTDDGYSVEWPAWPVVRVGPIIAGIHVEDGEPVIDVQHKDLALPFSDEQLAVHTLGRLELGSAQLSTLELGVNAMVGRASSLQ